MTTVKSIRLPRRADHVAGFETRGSSVKRLSMAKPIICKAAVTVWAPKARPGAKSVVQKAPRPL